jgi:hypothetical protein
MSKDIEAISKNYVIRSRTRYQLENFVISQHDTPEMQYRQILIEAQDLIYKIKLTELDIKKAQIKIEKLKDSNDPLDVIKKEKTQLSLAMTQMTLEGAKLELQDLENLFKKYPNYTPEQIEINQPEYWEKRLNRQAQADIVSAQQGISQGNLLSMLSAGLLSQNPETKEIL